jgi:Predicted DNA modification methylase
VEKGRVDLAFEEIRCLASIDNVTDPVLYDDGICVIRDFEGKNKLAFTKRIGRIIGIFDDLSEIKDIILPEGKFYVRVVDINNCHGTETEPLLGEMLGGRGRISFKENDFIIVAYHLDRWYLTEQIYNRDTLESNRRRAPLRPFFSPISMDPYFASFLINIGYFKKGSRILDPFCGGEESCWRHTLKVLTSPVWIL